MVDPGERAPPRACGMSGLSHGHLGLLLRVVSDLPSSGVLPAVAQSIPEEVDTRAAEIVERHRASGHGHPQRLA